MRGKHGTRDRASEVLAGAGVMTRRGFVRTVTFAAGAVVAVGPAALVIVFLIMQRYIVQGVRLSGIRG